MEAMLVTGAGEVKVESHVVAQARIEELEAQLKAKRRDVEGLEIRINEYERERLELYGEVMELKRGKEYREDLTGRDSAMEMREDIEDEEKAEEGLTRELEEAKRKLELQSGALRALSGKLAGYESGNRRTEFELEKAEKALKVTKKELLELQLEHEESQGEAQEILESNKQKSAALRLLSKRGVLQERELERLFACVDAFDLERCEFYREKVELLGRLAAQAEALDGMQKELENVESEMPVDVDALLKEGEHTGEGGSTIDEPKLVAEDGTVAHPDDEMDNQYVVTHRKRECVLPQVNRRGYFWQWKALSVGALGVVAALVTLA